MQDRHVSMIPDEELQKLYKISIPPFKLIYADEINRRWGWLLKHHEKTETCAECRVVYINEYDRKAR